MSDNETWLGADLSEDSRHCFHSGSVDQDPMSVAVLSTCESLVSTEFMLIYVDLSCS